MNMKNNHNFHNRYNTCGQLHSLDDNIVQYICNLLGDSVTKECDNYSYLLPCINIFHVHHDKCTVGLLFFNLRNLHYSVFALGHECTNTYTCAVCKQTKTHKMPLVVVITDHP